LTSIGTRNHLTGEPSTGNIERELKKIGNEMKVAVSVVGTAGPAAELATNRLAELQDRVTLLNTRRTELSQESGAVEADRIDPEKVKAALIEFDSLWEQLSPWEQERLIRTLVEQVRYDGQTGTVTLAFGSRGLKDVCCWAPNMPEKL
jgi:site-specific DNA recombinase